MFKILIFSTILIFTIGCSKKNNPNNTDTTTKSTNFNGGPCSVELKEDYNEMIQTCHLSAADDCNSSIDSFLEEYPNVNCKAIRDNDQIEVQIVANEIEALMWSHTDGKRCTQQVIENYNALLDICENPSANCNDSVNVFLSTYQNLNCKTQQKTITETTVRETFLNTGTT